MPSAIAPSTGWWTPTPRSLKATPTKGLRHGIIHANTPTDHAIDVMARLQRDFDAGYPEAQAPFLWWIGDNYAGNLGPARSRRLKPFQHVRAEGREVGRRVRLSR